MDERQQQIKAGAGLEESRINQDLIDFLQKWGSWILMALAVAALIYAGMGWLERQREAKVNEAFAALEGARAGANPSPDALRRVADEYEGIKSVAELARLESADVILDAVRVGVRPGAQINADGSLESDTELLTDDDRSRYLDQAESLYAAVLDATREKPGKKQIAISAMFGLAAVYETKGEVDRARTQLESVATMGESIALPAIARMARDRIELLTSEAAAPLPTRDQLPELPTPPEPEAPAGVDPDLLMPPLGDVPPDSAGDDAPSGDEAAPAADEGADDAPSEDEGAADDAGDDADAGSDETPPTEPDQP